MEDEPDKDERIPKQAPQRLRERIPITARTAWNVRQRSRSSFDTRK